MQEVPIQSPLLSVTFVKTATDRDREYMRRALNLAARGRGKTFPNPAVGCVIVKEDSVRPSPHPCTPSTRIRESALGARRGISSQGRNATCRSLRPSCSRSPPPASLMTSCFASLANEAHGATAYVTLEPCSHYGQTPPCSRALVQSKIAKVCPHILSTLPETSLQVVVGIVDPNPLVSGQGLKTLEDAGIDVIAGCLQEECYAMNRDFMERMSTLITRHTSRSSAA